MTLKLIDKDLRNKYAEALYKNELSHEKEIETHDKRLTLELVRNSQMIDASQQIFLNKVKQKRTKWSQDDLRFRDHYKLVCRNVQNKKLQNINNLFVSKRNKKQPKQQVNPVHSSMNVNELSNLLDNTLFYDGDSGSLRSGNGASLLPPQYKTDDADLYDLFSTTDADFLDKFPAKIEITLTDVGRQYIDAERTRHRKLERQTKNFDRVQKHALHDARFHELVHYLESKSNK